MGAEVYLPGVISRAETVAAGLSPRSEGVATARGDGVCGGEVVALPIPNSPDGRYFTINLDTEDSDQTIFILRRVSLS